MRPLKHPLAVRRFADWPLACKSILAMWAAYSLTVVARAMLGTDPGAVVQNKLITIVAGVWLTGLVYLAVALLGAGRDIKRRALIAGVASAIAACAMAGILMGLEDLLRPSREEFRFPAKEGMVIVDGRSMRIERQATEPLVLTLPKLAQLEPMERLRYAADAAVIWFFFFAAWSAFYIATLAQREAHEALSRAVDAEAAAQAAQVRALRYQVNPHFLFNTLNSLSSLVMTGRSDRAEAMLLALSTFFRHSLSLDPAADVTLAQEIDLQRLYLDIETTRFPDRLQVEIEVPEELSTAALPALILQPIVENAIKYGVATSRDKVLIRIHAELLEDRRIRVSVTNRLLKPGPKRLAAATHEGTGLGLANVCQRLHARFGSRAQCNFGPTNDGGYRVALTLPVDNRG
ncbi:sensor histidine kinase [Sphingomonas sinipercae]|uniref:Sensor histidine kinase n=1 Tax=Sphingomonas sinipercae TaxID=2714944 RepID=A0A6G7ZPQ2_9SPHN|nr:histidine kinase [Sphingomonas sinipercae]QIL02880.1 sensor histidine kinase [Sphingomonas sinipercae]